MTSEASKKRRSLDALTGLRFVAAFLVLIAHTCNAAWPGKIRLGHLASNSVSFFFVLSGFILTYVYFDRLRIGNVLKFYRARWARIWPLHVACLIPGIIVWRWTGHTTSWSNLWPRLASHFTLTQSWIPVRSWANWFNGPAWSVSTELGFYVVFPLLLWLGRKRFWPVLLALIAGSAALLIAAQVLWLPDSDNRTIRYFLYVNPIFRVFDFAIGMMCGRIFLNWIDSDARKPPVTSNRNAIADTFYELGSVLLVCASLYLFTMRGPVAGLLAGDDWFVFRTWLERGAGSAIPFGILLLVFSVTRGMLSRLFSSATFVYLGEISYALYLVQSPIITGVENLPATEYTSPFLIFAVLHLLCFGLAALLHHFVENPFRQLLVGTNRSERRILWSRVVGMPGGWRRSRLNTLITVGSVLAISGLFASHWIIDPGKRKSEEAALWKDSAASAVSNPVEFDGEAVLKAIGIETNLR